MIDDNSSRGPFDQKLKDNASISRGIVVVLVIAIIASGLFLAAQLGVDASPNDFLLYEARLLFANALLIAPGLLVFAFSTVWLRHNFRVDGALSAAISLVVIGSGLVAIGLALLVQYSDFATDRVPARTREHSADLLAAAPFLGVAGVAIMVLCIGAVLILTFVFIVRTGRELRIEPEPATPGRFFTYAVGAIAAIAGFALLYPALFPPPLSATAEDGHAFDDVAFLPYDTSTDGQNPLPGNARFEFAPQFSAEYGWVQDDADPTDGSWHNADGCTVAYSIAAAGTYLPGDDQTASENAVAALVGAEWMPDTSDRDDFRFAASRAALEDNDTSWWNAAVYTSDTRFVVVRSISETQTTVTIDASCENPTTFLDDDVWNNMVLVGAN